MDKKKILIVSRSFYPENSPRSFRTTELVKEFCRQGHQVKLITFWRPELQALQDEFGFEWAPLAPMTWPRPTVKGKGIQRLFTRLLTRFSKLLLEYPDIQLVRLVSKALKKESGHDLLISIAVPHPVHWGVAKARTTKHPIATIWVADCGDPYMGQENDSFKAPFYFAWVEKWFCRKADYLSVPTAGSVAAYYPEFHSKISVIPQGFKFEEVHVKESTVENEVPTFGYGGIFIPGRRDPTAFLTYLVEKPIDFRFHVFTKTPELVKPFLEASKGRVVLHEPLDRAAFLYELSGYDFVVNFENFGAKQTPSKLIDYAIIQKPILSIKTGAMSAPIVDEFLDKNYRNAIVVDAEMYRIETLVNQFLSLLPNS